MAKRLFIGLCIIGGLAALWYFKDSVQPVFFRPKQADTLMGTNSIAVEEKTRISSTEPDVIAADIEVPWEIAFLPDASLLVTSRPGKVFRVYSDNKHAIPISGVNATGEGGLLGLALHPDFATTKWVYIYKTTQSDGKVTNQVERYVFNDQANTFTDRTEIITNIPGSVNHDGGRIAFGPDRLLYITTGDAGNEQAAQNTGLLQGKILRVTDSGAAPTDNPFGNAVYSYGHRNPQGIAWDSQGRLWATEHGPSGLNSGYDEVNLIRKGRNYGWPTIRGEQTQAGMIAPVIQSGGDDTWAPAGLEIVNDVLYFTGLRGEALYSTSIQGESVGELVTLYKQKFGRLRVVKRDPTGQWLYFATSNTDGRGNERSSDDKILRVQLGSH